MAAERDSDFTEDAFLGGRLLLRQPTRGHRAGHDAILLAAACPAKPGERIAEFGAGVGTAGFALASRVGEIALILLEIDPALASLAASNAEINRIDARVCVIDVTSSAAIFAGEKLTPDSFDGVLMNPPFHDAARHRASENAARASAHMDQGSTLTDWISAARRLLRSGGHVTLIWRADGLAKVLDALASGFGDIEVRVVHPDKDRAAIRVLVTAIKGSRAPLTLVPPLVLNDADGKTSAETEAVLRGVELPRIALR